MNSLSAENKLKILKTIYISSLLNGNEISKIYSDTKPTEDNVGLINKMLSLAVNTDWYISNLQIREDIVALKIE